MGSSVVLKEEYRVATHMSTASSSGALPAWRRQPLIAGALAGIAGGIMFGLMMSMAMPPMKPLRDGPTSNGRGATASRSSAVLRSRVRAGYGPSRRTRSRLPF